MLGSLKAIMATLNLMLTGWQQHYLASLEHDNNKLQQATNATRGMDGYRMTCITKHP